MNDIFVSILPIFIIAMLGIIIKRTWISSEEFWRGLEKLSYFLLFPLVLFNHTSAIETSSHDLLKLILLLMLSIGIVSIMLIIYRRKTQGCKRIFTSIFQGSIRFNNYIFLALSHGFFGSKKMSIVAIVSAYMVIYTNILSVLIFSIYANSHNNQIKPDPFKIIKNFSANPLIIASLIGLTFNYFGIVLNVGIKNTIDILSNSALAIGVMSVGARLQFNLNTKHMLQIIIALLTKLVILPLITIIIFFIANITGDLRAVGILFSCLPPASTSYLLSQQLHGDPNSMATIITFTTVFSLLSLSIIMYIFA
ncbi:membrane transport family protein [Orientia chuto str. Dubai]|uniref:Membrane transport family protein n=1 Tax=Orientia chuto str. Dubai TaxID=1359168 RepID=A0A0F3ML53_9RICK|nr:AEC family transporter [Candidatus Orientia mediorientalis]KJV56177.1 membrane transport family protein [Orientia chuto str. Dubai]